MTAWMQRVYREVDASAGRLDRAEGPARRALLIGIWISASLLVTGLALTFLRDEIRPQGPPTLSEMARGVMQLHGICLAYAGLLALAATPILRVVVMIGVYARRREWFMLAVSAIVLGLLTTGLLLGTG